MSVVCTDGKNSELIEQYIDVCDVEFL
jgi:hypothetical protein